MKTAFNLCGLATALGMALAAQLSYAQPTIVTQPASAVYLYPGGTLSLTVSATDTLPISYQWQEGSSTNGPFMNLANGGQISGATNATLVIGDVSSNNDGDYVLVLSDSGGSVTSSVTVFAEVPAPTDFYGKTVLSNNPVAYWRLNETNGTVIYDYAGGYNGTYYGGTAPKSTTNSATIPNTTEPILDQPGIGVFDTNPSVFFNGISDGTAWGGVPFNQALWPPVFTMECWVNEDTQAGVAAHAGTMGVFGGLVNVTNGSAVDTDAGIWIRALDSGSDFWSLWCGEGYSTASPTIIQPGSVSAAQALALNQWYHLVATYDGTNLAFYVNGAQAFSQAAIYTPMTNATSELGIGCYYAGNPPDHYAGSGLVGWATEYAIYNYPLTSNQVLSHYAAAISGGEVAPVIVRQPPSPLGLYAGETATLSVQALSYTPPTYQWMVGSGGLYTNLVNGGQISGATTPTLVISNLALTNTADYVVVVSNAAGSVSNTVALTVQPLPTDAYGAAVLLGNPLAYWRMNETSGTVMYDYVGGYNGAYEGGVTPSGAGLSAYDTNQGQTFNGATGYAQVPYYAALNGSNFTVECWVDPTGGMGNQRAAFANQNNGGASGYDLFAYPAGPDQWEFEAAGNSDLGAGGVALDQWTHLVGTYDGSNEVLYVDGQPVETNSDVEFAPNTAFPLYIGAGDNDQTLPAYYWTGVIEEAALYGAALTPSEVAAHYQIATTGVEPRMTIATQPQPVALYVGETASFTVAVNTLQPPAYQWMAGSSTNGPFTAIVNAANISGATSATLDIADISLTNAGYYIVVVSNSINSVTSSPVALVAQPLPTDSYGEAVLAAGPVAYWRMSETNGTVMYDYLGGHNGVYYGNVTLGQPGISSNYDTNKAVVFDGSTAYAQVPYYAALNGSRFSVECWVKTTNGGSGNLMTPIANEYTVTGNDQGYNLNAQNAFPDYWNFEIGIIYFTFESANGPAVASNQWTHLVGTFDGNNEILYVNGQPVNTNTEASGIYTNNTVAPLNIGAGNNDYATPSSYWLGSITEAAVYSNVLSPAAIESHYALAALGGFTVPTIVTNPVSLDLYAGRTASFNVAGFSLVPLSYQWAAGSSTNGPFTNLANGGEISGATSSNLVIRNISSANALYYQAEVINGAGSVYSTSAQLTVQPAPTDVYGQAVLADNPFAFWRLNETTVAAGAVMYDYAGGYNGTYRGQGNANGNATSVGTAEDSLNPASPGGNLTVTAPVIDQPGIGSFDTDLSVYFNSDSDGDAFGYVPYSQALWPPVFTYECWANNSSQTGLDAHADSNPVFGALQNINSNNPAYSTVNVDVGIRIIAVGNPTTPPSNYWTCWWGKGYGFTTTTQPGYTAAQFLSLSNWYHLVVTYNGANMTFYVNGVRAFSDATTYCQVREIGYILLDKSSSPL